MKQILLMIAVVVANPVLAVKPLTKGECAKFIEVAIRKHLKKPTGELTKADYEKVKFLSLRGYFLTNVTGLEKLTQLERLSLHNNKLTDLKGLETLTKLETLDVGGNQLTNVKGLEKLTKLKLLFLSASYKLDDLNGLEKLNQLKELYLRNCPNLTKAQIAELQKALPKCKIHSNPTK